jgi:UDP-sugar transporter A1/2/3
MTNCVILLHKKAIGGILVALTMKYGDNILKTFATANSIVLSCVISHCILGDGNLDSTSPIAISIILLATFLYSVKTTTKVPPHSFGTIQNPIFDINAQTE